MELNWLKLNKFKRFEKATLNTSGKVVAILGPNEVGKSSLLEALSLLNGEGKFYKDIHLTRGTGKDRSDEEIVLEAGFLLSDDDRQAIAHLHQGDLVRWLIVKKLVKGERKFEIKPPLQRNFCYRNRVISCLKLLTDFSHIKDIYKEASLEIQELISLLEKSIETNTSLDKIIKNKLNIFLDKTPVFIAINEELITEGEKIKQKHDFIEELTDSINKLLEYEQDIHPNEECVKILKDKLPKILNFNDNCRNLASSFNLRTLDKEKPNQALENLLKIAKLNILELSEAVNNRIEIINLIAKANENIDNIYEGKWSQSGVKPFLLVNNSLLEIVIKDDCNSYSELRERSDGLLQFVALINFLEIEHTTQPILLVDEAELHLHYDAQADLIQIFSEQKLASKIIYTTHSIGCLPEDLGTGVKLVCPIDKQRSKIVNYFGTEDKRAGFSPLLFGMGATRLSFVPLRPCVLVEGLTDMLLLPTLFRQATSLDYLKFQIAPGLAEMSKTNLSLLENQAPQVGFLIDNDEEGKKYKKQLKKSGIKENKIFYLPNCSQTKVLEDYIRKDLYLEVINEELKNWNTDRAEICFMSLEDLPNSNRPKAVEAWCDQHQLKLPDKKVVTYHLLDLATGERQETLIEESLQQPLVELYQKIVKVLGL